MKRNNVYELKAAEIGQYGLERVFLLDFLKENSTKKCVALLEGNISYLLSILILET